MEAASTIQRSATMIQRFSRRYCAKSISTRSIGLGLTGALRITFDQLKGLLRRKLTIAIFKCFLQRMHRGCTKFNHVTPGVNNPPSVNVRVVLAAYMIAFRPSHVFDTMGELETALHAAATPLLESLESLCRSIQQHGIASLVHSEQAKAFPALLFEYLKCFNAWKVTDEARLTSRIKHALVALYQALDHIPSDDHENLILEFRTQIEKMENKLKLISGEDALVAFQLQHRRVVTHSNNVRPVVPPGRMTNEQLAHELLLDPRFQLLENGGLTENPLFRRIRETFHQAFWDSLVDDLKLTPPCYVRVLRVLAEIRDGISQLAVGNDSTLITEIIDLDLIKQQIGLFTWDGCVSFMGSIVGVIGRVQAPQRGEETSSKWAELHRAMLISESHPSQFCNGLEFLLNRVNVMRVDGANARLRLIAPIIKDHGLEYERFKLAGKLHAGTITLERTEAWIRKAVLDNTPPDNSDSSYKRVVREALVGLVSGGDVDYPETLEFDIHRLKCLGAAFRNSTLALTMLYVAHSHIKKVCVRLSDVKSQVESIAKFLQTSCIITEAEIEELMPDNRAKTLFDAFQQCAAPNNAVHVLAHARMCRLWLGDDTPNLGVGKLLSIQTSVTQLRALETINIGVHGERYNTMIAAADASREQRREDKAARNKTP